MPTPPPYGVRPFATAAEAAKARRRVVLGSVAALASVLLAVLTSHRYDDVPLVTTYLAAAAVHLLVAVVSAVRLAATPSEA